MLKETWRKWISYIIPQTRYIKSEINGHLEVGWIEGKKVLDSMNTNYSYGPLQDVLNYGLQKIPLEYINSVLVLGMGAGSVIRSLREKFQYSKRITAVELDPVVLKIAAEDFGIVADEYLEVYCQDAAEFIRKTKQTFDLIIVDIFIDKEVPAKFFEETFWLDIALCTNEYGKIIFNAGVEDLDKKIQEAFLNRLPKVFDYSLYTNVLGGNTLIILSK